jgi:hypothetical protein
MGALRIIDFVLLQNLGMTSAASVGFVFGAVLVLFFFWDGRNWARWLILIGSVLNIFSLFTLGRASPLEGAVIVIETMLGIFLIFWLNTTTVRDYFRRV